MYKMKDLTEGRVFVNRSDTRFNISQEEDALNIVFDDTGVFVTNNRYIHINSFLSFYDFEIIGDKIKVDDYGDGIRIPGKRKTTISLPPEFYPKRIPEWKKAILKRPFAHQGTKIGKGTTLEFYKTPDFTGLVIKDSKDPTVPNFKNLQDLFGKRFGYLSTGAKFTVNEPVEISKLVKTLIKSKELVQYQADNGDIVITEERYEDRIFKLIDIPEDREAENLLGIDDISKTAIDALREAYENLSNLKTLEKGVEDIQVALSKILERIEIDH